LSIKDQYLDYFNSFLYSLNKNIGNRKEIPSWINAIGHFLVFIASKRQGQLRPKKIPLAKKKKERRRQEIPVLSEKKKTTHENGHVQEEFSILFYDPFQPLRKN
jgi:hypothetical protein